jgi:hypothetical protein
MMKKREEALVKKLSSDRDALLTVAKRVLAEREDGSELMEYLRKVVEKVEGRR